jgi:hypothetical protein
VQRPQVAVEAAGLGAVGRRHDDQYLLVKFVVQNVEHAGGDVLVAAADAELLLADGSVCSGFVPSGHGAVVALSGLLVDSGEQFDTVRLCLGSFAVLRLAFLPPVGWTSGDERLSEPDVLERVAAVTLRLRSTADKESLLWSVRLPVIAPWQHYRAAGNGLIVRRLES